MSVAHLRHLAARSFLGLALLLCVADEGLAGEAQPGELDRELGTVLGGVPVELTQALFVLRQRGIPTALIEQKLQEGVAKRVPPARIGEVLTRIAAALAWIEDEIAGCGTPAQRRAREALRALATDALLSGVEREQLAPTLAGACAREDPADWAAATGELHFYLVNKLAAAPPRAWTLAAAAISTPDAHAGVSSLVLVFQDVYRVRGSVDRALEVATRRLQDGASLRRVRLELAEQFLR